MWTLIFRVLPGWLALFPEHSTLYRLWIAVARLAYDEEERESDNAMCHTGAE